MFDKLREDIRSIKERDPAATSNAQVFFLYSGLHAVIYYRIAHYFYKKKHYFIARMLSQRARHKTGIEIHPGATIGKGLFIDHGSGVVIGETTIIGDYCTIYQNVTLGGTGKDQGKRHPTLGDNVMVGAGAKILGPIEIGDNSKVAAGAVVLKDVPPRSTAVGIPAKLVTKSKLNQESCDLNQIDIPDPVAIELAKLKCRLDYLESKIKSDTNGD